MKSGNQQRPARNLRDVPNLRNLRNLRDASGFTLVELMVSVAVLALLVLLINQLFSSAAALTLMGGKQMDANGQARAFFDRMAVDFGQMLKRPDVDYYLKSAPANLEVGNDQMAFFSQVPGYSGTAAAGGTTQSPVSLVAYRINANQAERLGTGLQWNGVTSGTAVPFGPSTIATTWPSAVSNPNPDLNPDPNYEVVGPGVFRMEYYYLLRGQILSSGSTCTALPSNTPWDTRAGHGAYNGLEDVAAIVVVIGVIDPKSRLLVTSPQLTSLASAMEDFPTTVNSGSVDPMNPGDLEAQWQSAINSSGLPPAATSAMRVYRRCFYLTSGQTGVLISGS